MNNGNENGNGDKFTDKEKAEIIAEDIVGLISSGKGWDPYDGDSFKRDVERIAYRTIKKREK